MTAPDNQPRSRIKFSLLSLLAMPFCFEAGWFLHGWTFQRDLEAEAHQMIKHVNGFYVPELGIVVGGKDARARHDEISAQSPEEVQQRLDFFRRLRGGSSNTTPWPTSTMDEPGMRPEQ